MEGFKEELKKRQEEFEACLKEMTYQDGEPKTLFESLNYSLFIGGKRIRPVMLLAACESVGGDKEDAMPLACAMEMIHTYSLVHDDLPAMDDDDLRRGEPTNHKVYGEATAILAGDALLNMAYEVMIGGAITVRDKDAYIEAMEQVAINAGAKGMIAGQVADIESEGEEPDKETLSFIHNHKTGALLRASVISGAMVGGASEDELDNLTKYAEAIGLMFQIRDDILDVVGDEKVLGKKTGADSEHGKMTYPYVYGLNASHKKIEELLEIALKNLETFGERGNFLRNLAKYLADRNY